VSIVSATRSDKAIVFSLIQALPNVVGVGPPIVSRPPRGQVSLVQ
jgi:hypothetical protein